MNEGKFRDLVIRLLSDENGVGEDVWLLIAGDIPNDLLDKVKCNFGRFYLPEDSLDWWDTLTQEQKGFFFERGMEFHGPGIVKSPGKFEGEMFYVPLLWEMHHGEFDDNYLLYHLTPFEANQWMGGEHFVRLHEDDQGYVEQIN